MTISTASSPPRSAHQVLYLRWQSEFLPWLTGRLGRVTRDGGPVGLPPPWAPGEHFALIGPTGEGKTTFEAGILQTRKYVLALDPKGEDETLQASGFQRVTGLPPRKRFPKEIQRDLEEGRPVRLIVGGGAKTDEEDQQLQKLMREAIAYARHAGGWTLSIDEFELLSSQRMYNLAPPIDRMLITARRARSSVVTAYQAQAWVSKHATRQASLCAMWPTRDRDMVKAMAQAMGRDWRLVCSVIDELPPYHALVVPKGHRHPMLITSAPKIS